MKNKAEAVLLPHCHLQAFTFPIVFLQVWSRSLDSGVELGIWMCLDFGGNSYLVWAVGFLPDSPLSWDGGSHVHRKVAQCPIDFDFFWNSLPLASVCYFLLYVHCKQKATLQGLWGWTSWIWARALSLTSCVTSSYLFVPQLAHL